ncbi:MAG: hypothetical protein KJ069_19765 [Anaerolineae bacterium]|nr:hypothetical protein [Anaerolineae bacterium]
MPEDTATVAPTRVMVAVTDTAVPLSPTAINTPETVSSPTPAPMCTPPACTENEVYFCPGDCPNGCGTVCVTPTPDNLGPAPATWAELETWLVQAWQDGIEPHTVQIQLQEAGWQYQVGDMTTVDLNANGDFEWLLSLYLPGQEANSKERRLGNLWVIGQAGIFFRYYMENEDPEIGDESVPIIIGFAEMNGDSLPEIAINREMCGAHTCTGQYQILNYANGTLQNIVAARPSLNHPEFDTITMSFSDTYFADHDGDGLQDFFVHGGASGSAGAGIERTYTEVWSWNGSAITLTDVILDPSQYRHHILYEANNKFAYANIARLDEALVLYEKAINDDSLLTPPPMSEGTEEDVRAAINQFAAFRLILIDLLQGNSGQAFDRLSLLNRNYPNTPITQAAQLLLTNWQDLDHPFAFCNEITAMLETAEDPTGPLVDLGYGNPSLTAVDVCPVP